MNESVLAMIDKLHARLDDLAEAVRDIPYELNGYDEKLDKIDDQVYLIEVELEKKLSNSVPLKPVTKVESEAFDTAAEKTDTPESSPKACAEENEDEETEGFLSDSAKETLAGATRTLNSIYKDGKEVFGEFGEAFSDIKDTFGVKGFFKKR